MQFQDLAVDIDITDDAPEAEFSCVATVLEFWMRQYEKAGAIPTKSALDPVNFPKSLPYSWIYEYLEEEDSFHCRLSGSEIDEIWGKRLSGNNLREIFPDGVWQGTYQRMCHVIRTPAIMHARIYKSTRTPAVERLALPLADKDGKVRFVFGISFYMFDPDRFDPDTEPDFIHFHRLTR